MTDIDRSIARPGLARPADRRQPLELAVTLAVLALLIFAGFLVLRPFLAAVLWGVVLVVATWAGVERLTSLLGGRRTLAAAIATLVLALILVGPLILLGSRLAGGLAEVATRLRAFIDHGLQPPAWVGQIPLVGPSLLSYWHQLITDDATLRNLAGLAIRPVALWLLASVTALGNGLLQVALAVFCTFFFYRSGPVAVRNGRNLLRHIAGDRADTLITVAHLTMRGVVFGVLGAAAVQGLLAGLGFWVAGLPRVILLAVATFLTAIVPGAAFIVLVPVTVYAFYALGTGWAVALLVWNFGIVGQVDNLIRPMAIARGTSMPILLVLFGVIGGLGAFGFLGLFLGPTLLALLYSLMQEWSRDEAGG